MKLRPLLVAVVILAALALAAYVLRRPPAPAAADPRVGRPVLDPAAVERATRIELADQGKRVEIARQGAAWIVPSYYGLPADLAKLSQFVDDLNRATVQRVVTRDPARLARLDFKGATVALIDAAGRPAWTLALGRDADSGGRFIRYDDEPQAYLANLALFLDTEPKNWADSQLVNLKPDDIAAVAVAFPDGTAFGATRARREAPWTAEKTPSGMRLKDDRIAALLSSFTNLRFQDTADPKSPDVEAARQHRRTVRLTTFAHQTVTVELGRRPAPPPAPAAPAPPEVQSTEDRGQGGTKPGAQPTGAQGTGDRGREAVTAGPKPSTPAGSEPKNENPKPKTENAPPPPPAGPVYASVTSSDPAAPVNAAMKQRAFQIFDWVFNDLPQNTDDFFEPVPKTPPAPASAGSVPKTQNSEPRTLNPPAPAVPGAPNPTPPKP